MNTPENITTLKSHEVFVFGSNLEGRHFGGAARTAFDKFGAVMGKGVGTQGQSYAIPSMGGIDQLRMYAVDFIEYAELRPDLTFYLTRVGCGIAGYTDEEIAPIFKDCPLNVIKPAGWEVDDANS